MLGGILFQRINPRTLKDLTTNQSVGPRDDYRKKVFSWRVVDLKAINQIFGTTRQKMVV